MTFACGRAATPPKLYESVLRIRPIPLVSSTATDGLQLRDLKTTRCGSYGVECAVDR